MRPRGFTLIELIIVIVLLAIVAGFSFRFVGIGSAMYATGAARVKLLDQSRFSIERVKREVRNSVPNSARVYSGTTGGSDYQCLEFVPVKWAASYYDLPRAANPDETFTAVSLTAATDNLTATGSHYDRLIVYATRQSQIYSEDDGAKKRRWSKLANDITLATPPRDIELTVATGYLFQRTSPQQRLFVGQAPVSYCVIGDELARYSDYGWIRTGNALPSVPPQLMGENITNLLSPVTVPFIVENATLYENNIVHIVLTYQTDAGERLFYNQEVHIPNAP